MKIRGLKLKKIMAIWAVAVATTVPSAAQEYGYMQFTLANGDTQYFKAEGLKLTFSGGNVVVTSQDGKATLALGELASMAFAGNPSAVDGVMQDNGNAEAVVFTPQGACVGAFKDMDEAAMQLQRGVYLVRQNGKTVKKVLR